MQNTLNTTFDYTGKVLTRVVLTHYQFGAATTENISQGKAISLRIRLVIKFRQGERFSFLHAHGGRELMGTFMICLLALVCPDLAHCWVFFNTSCARPLGSRSDKAIQR